MLFGRYGSRFPINYQEGNYQEGNYQEGNYQEVCQLIVRIAD